MICPLRPTRCSWIEVRSTEQAQRGAHRLLGQEGVRRLEARALAVHLAPGIGLVALDEAHRAARDREHAALAALLDPPQHLLLDQHVVGEVVLAGLQHRARRAHRVAAALDLEAVEEGPVRHVVGLVDLGADQVARPELGEPVGPGARPRGIMPIGLAGPRALDGSKTWRGSSPPPVNAEAQ